MANFSKWMGAGLGWTFGGPIGAILGFVFGSFMDEFSEADLIDFQRSTGRSTGGSTTTKSGDFEVSLLVLAAVVIKADGKAGKQELKFVRQTFIRMYGKKRADHAFKLFKGIIKKNNISTRQVCMQIRQNMNHASRLQLMHFLFGVAKADGMVTEKELNKIQTISGYLYINPHDFNSIKAMFYNEVNSAYRILEIKKSASDTEVKKAYRKMVKKYHPDKLRNLGPEHVKGAEEKFRQVQKAYEQIHKERGI